MTQAHVIPFVLYLFGTSFLARFGEEWYPLCYGSLVIVLLIYMYALLSGKAVLRPHWRVLPGVTIGLIGIVLWIVLANLHLEEQLTQWLPTWLRPESRVAYNPFEQLSGINAWAFITVRLIGIAVVVPLVEEIFWRGFLLRWLIDPEWEKVPLGEFTWASCLTVTLMFTLAHPEWLAAVVYCLLINGLLYWRKDLWLCVVAHATSNLALAFYVLGSGEWWLW